MSAARTSAASIRAGRHSIPITHPAKLMFRRPNVTKLELAGYYEQVAGSILPYLRRRPLALQVFPQGTDKRGFFMKAVPEHFPGWIGRVEVPKKGGSLTQVVAESAATLIYLAGQNVVTPHVWLSRADAPRQPDRLIIDLDPSPGIGFSAVRAAAREAGARLRDAGLLPYAMVTGSRGIHVVCPLRRGPAFTDVHRFARALAERMVADDPKRLTLEWHRAERGARIYLDVNRINYAQHGVAPYGVRARPGAPVALPLRWEELEDRGLKPDGWSVQSVPARLRAEGDAWKDISRHSRKLPALMSG